MMTAILLFSVAIAIIINIDGLRSQAIQQRYEHIICSHHTMKNEQEHQLSSKLFICYKQQIEALKLAHQIRILGICRNFSKFRFRGSVGIRNVDSADTRISLNMLFFLSEVSNSTLRNHSFVTTFNKSKYIHK